jgi:2',3'-cyclic-nucleotide 2'-phosphodiesterase (5'-nucleotidase family)
MRHFIVFLLLGMPFLGNAQKAGSHTADRKLTILYTNDLHAHLDAQKIDWISKTRLVGGFANIASLVKSEKVKNTHAVYFDAGDYFTGPYISSLTKGAAIIDVMNNMSIDAACIGNHEFDHGWTNLLAQLKRAKFPILNGNIFIKRTNKLLWNHPYKIIVKNGIRIGVIGLHGKFAFYDTISDEMIQGVEARDEVAILQQYIDSLKGKADLIVLLIHEGIPGRQSSTGATDVSRNLQKDIELAQQVKGLNIMVTGHAHQGTPEALISNGTLIVSTDALGMELGRLDIEYNIHNHTIDAFTNKLNYVYNDSLPADKPTLAAINKWKFKLKHLTEEPAGNITEPLTRSYGGESTLGNMITDAMLATNPNCDFAMVNSGGLRQDIEKGPVTLGNLISAFPFPNTLVKLELKGSDILSLLEHAAGLTNGVLQVSKGFVYTYNEAQPPGKRIVTVQINGQPLDKDKTYKLLAPNFLTDGGDGYSAFKNGSNKQNTQIVIVQPMLQYLKSFKSFTPVLEGRIIKQQ